MRDFLNITPDSFYALGNLEIFKVDNPHKVSCSIEVL